jgi:hypothetical protein
MSVHSWCHDIQRDEAVRAAEDGRTAPLPTLEEAIARPFAEAAECSVPVSETAEPQSGLREQRVSLSLKRMGELIEERDAAIRERDAAVARADEDARAYNAESDARAQAQQELQDRCDTAIVTESAGIGAAERLHRETWLRLERDELIIKRDELISRVAELESQLESVADRAAAAETELEAAPAASGGGEGEPVAWGVRMKSGSWKGFLFPTKEQANRCAELITDDVVALFEAPPQPRGWLTQDERLALAAARTILDGGGRTNIGVTITAILARSSPPEVVLPELHTRCEVNEANHKSPCLWFRRPDVIAALAAAGVTVKEVGK